MLLHYLGKLKNQKFALHARKTSQVWLFITYATDICQMSWKYVQRLINTMQNNNILLFVRSLSLTSLVKALQLSKVRSSTIKHQHSKNLTLEPKTHEKSKMQIVCKSLFTKSVQMSTICTYTCLEELSALVNCSVGHRTIPQLSVPPVR